MKNRLLYIIIGVLAFLLQSNEVHTLYNNVASASFSKNESIVLKHVTPAHYFEDHNLAKKQMDVDDLTDDEIDDDYCHEANWAIPSPSKLRFSTSLKVFPTNFFSAHQGVKLFILLCSLKLHC